MIGLSAVPVLTTDTWSEIAVFLVPSTAYLYGSAKTTLTLKVQKPILSLFNSIGPSM